MNEISDDVSMAPETMDMGGAPPHTDTLIHQPPVGGSKIGQFKRRGAPALRPLLLSCSCSCFSLRSLSRTTWKPVRWTLALIPTETNHLKSPRPCQSRNIAEPAANSPVIPKRLPGDVTQQRREPAEVPRATFPRGN